MEIADVVPPDDSGRDAFSRYRYQAHAVFPACLQSATGNGAIAVICEHIEDVCIETEDRVVLRQIKTRNPEYGAWRLLDLCRPHGALRSIVRAHRAVQGIDDGRAIVYQIQLEGFLARQDAICRLRRRTPAPDEAVAKAVVRAFRRYQVRLALREAREIVSRLVVITADPRETIVAANHRMLGALASHLAVRDVTEIYDRVVELICRAMDGTLVGDRWPEVLFAADSRSDGSTDLADKRLDVRTLCGPLKPATTGNFPSLSGLADLDLSGSTNLVRKLRLAGAPEALVERAQTLRAFASRREVELRARDQRGTLDNELEDLDNRLLTVGAIGVGLQGRGVAPAPAVFAEILDRLVANPDGHDPRALFHRDPMLLMGGVCQLSDECRQSWRADE